MTDPALSITAMTNPATTNPAMADPAITDNETIVRCQAGDRDAFRHLVEQYKDVLFGTAVLMTGNRAVANDCRPRRAGAYGPRSRGQRHRPNGRFPGLGGIRLRNRPVHQRIRRLRNELSKPPLPNRRG